MKSPFRVIEGSAKPFERFWALRNAEESESGEPEIEFYGYISEYSWWGDEVTPAMFKQDLNDLGKGGPVTVRINSGGGEVFAASAIRAMIMDYPGRVTTRIDGLCASAATYVAMAGDVVKMQDSAFFMIHDPSVIAWGDIEGLKTLLAELKTIKDGIVQTYQGKTGLDAEKLSKMMTAETWLSALEARELGFVDEVITGATKIKTTNRAYLNCLQNYEHVPAALLAEIEPEPWQAIDENVTEEADPDEPVESDTEETEPEESAPAAEDPAGDVEKDAQALRDYLAVFGPQKEQA